MRLAIIILIIYLCDMFYDWRLVKERKKKWTDSPK